MAPRRRKSGSCRRGPGCCKNESVSKRFQLYNGKRFRNADGRSA
jgi:hypothetical protein